MCVEMLPAIEAERKKHPQKIHYTLNARLIGRLRTLKAALEEK